ncbi:hypothetical protein RYX36_002292, partial [Vicia faba]
SEMDSGVRSDGIGPMETTASPSPSIDIGNNVRNTNIIRSAFQVKYTPEKSGFYDINVCCGNIMLNESHSFRKEVKA